MKMALKILLGIVVIALGVIVYLISGNIFQQAPKSTKNMEFLGFVVLPKTEGSGLISLLDYFTVEDRNLFVAGILPGAVYKVPLGSGKLPDTSEIGVIGGVPDAHGVVFDPASHFGFVSSTNAVDVFDPQSMQIKKRVPIDGDVDGIFFDPVNKLIFASVGDKLQTLLIDPASQNELGRIDLGGEPEFAVFDLVTQQAYQNLIDTNSIAVLDLAKRSLIKKWPLQGCDGPSGMAFDEVSRKLFVVCQNNATMVVLDLNSGRVMASVPIGGAADSVAYDSRLRRIYVAGMSGVVTVVQRDGDDKYRSLDPVNLPLGAHTLAVDPVTSRVYVGYLTLLTAPRVAVFGAR